MKPKSLLLHSLGALAFWGSIILALYSCNSSHHHKSSRLASIESNILSLSNSLRKTLSLVKDGDHILYQNLDNSSQLLLILSNHLHYHKSQSPPK